MDDLLDWCRRAGRFGDNDLLRLEPVSGDASFRTYYRLSGIEPTLIAVNSPPSTEKNREFVAIAGLLRDAGVEAPRVLAADMKAGFLLLSDLGNDLMLSALTTDSVDRHYATAIETLGRIQRSASSIGNWQLPAYSDELLWQEMSLFPHWFLEGLLGIEPNRRAAEMIELTFRRLVDNARSQPHVFVHRDYHSRNLMVLPEGKLGVIDFQDAVLGPVTYDLVSLLRDCYVAWSPERVRTWALDFRDAVGLNVEPVQFLRWFDLMGLQRHLKVLGIFARLYLRDGKAGYLQDLPLVMHYVLEVARGYPDLLVFVDWFESNVMPMAIREDWYQEPVVRP